MQNNPYENLVINYTNALQINSEEIALALEQLTKKRLNSKDKKALKGIDKSLKKINNNLKRGLN